MNTVEQATPGTRQIEQLHELAQQLRVDSIRSTTAAGSGHPTSSMSAADLMAVLMSSYLKYDFQHPATPNNDHLIFSKGHAAPLLYTMFKAAGAISDDELLTLRKRGSRIEGHPVPVLPWVDVATGSLGQGLPIGVGIRLAGKYLDKLPYRIWVGLGDSEMAEGSIWEAMELGGYYKLNNPGEDFPIGGSRVVQQSPADQVTVVAAGITLHEALKAYDQLEAQGVAIRVIDAYTVKPIDIATLHEAARLTNGQIVVVEDHWFEGGMGDAVLDAFAGKEAAPAATPLLPKITKLAVHAMPDSATPDQELDEAGISASHIVRTVKELVGKA